MDIGKRIQELRIKNGMSVEELASAINDTPEKINQYENDELEPSLDKKLAIANTFGVGLDYFTIINHYNFDSTNQKNYEENEETTSVEPIEGTVEDSTEHIDQPIGSASVKYDEETYDTLFGKNSTSALAFNIIFSICYIIAGCMFLGYDKAYFVSIILFILGIGQITRTIYGNIKQKQVKANWLQTYGNQKREFTFYDDYMIVRKDDASEEEKKFYYNEFQPFIDTTKYLITAHKTQQGLIIIIDKTTIDKEELPNITNALHLSNVEIIGQNKPEETGNKKLNTIAWVLVFASVFATGIVGILFQLITRNNYLWINVLKNVISLLIPISSIVVGIIFRIKYNFKSIKNIVVGILMSLMCFAYITQAITINHIEKSANNDEIMEIINTNMDVTLPSDYYTEYLDEKLDYKIVYNETEYSCKSWRIISFANAKEARKITESFFSKIDSQNPVERKFNPDITVVTTFSGKSYTLKDDTYFTGYIEKEDTLIEVEFDITRQVMFVIEYEKTK